MSARTVRRLLLLVLVAAALKLAFLAAPRNDLLGDRAKGRGVFTEMGEGTFTHHGEEGSRASIAIALREGPLVPVGDYQWTHFFGGSLVVGIAAVPYFALFGENLFVLKLVPLTFELLVVVFGYLLFERLFGSRAALIGGLLLAVSSPGQAVLSTIAWGTHASLNAFVLIGLFCYVLSLPLAQGRDAVRLRWRFALGIVAGFATWFGYSYLLVLAAVGAYELTRGRAAFALRPLAVLAAGFAIGFAPWVRYNLAHDFAGLHVYGRNVAEHFAPLELIALLPRRSSELVLDLFPGSLFHRDLGPVPGTWLAAAATVALLSLVVVGVARLVGSLAAARRTGRGVLPPHPGALLALHVGFVGLALMLSNFWPEDGFERVTTYRYLAPLFPGLIGLAAAGADRWIDRGSVGRTAAVVAVATITATSVAGHAGLVRPAQWGTLWRIEADSRPGHGRWIAARFGGDPDRMSSIAANILARRAPEQQDDLLRGIDDGLRIVIVNERRRQAGVYDLERLEESRRRLAQEMPEPWASLFATEPAGPGASRRGSSRGSRPASGAER